MSPESDKVCFIIMPFGDENTHERADYDDTYEDIIRKAVMKADQDLVCKRADDVTRSGSIPRDIFRDLHASRFVIADLTELNPNVMYELGIRHALKHRTILMARRGTKLPFDLDKERTIFYSKNTGKDREEVVSKICRYLQEMSPDTELDDSPVLRAIGEDSDIPDGRPAALENHLKRKEYRESIGKQRFAKRLCNLLAVMDWETFDRVAVPKFFKAFVRKGNEQQAVLYLVMKQYEPNEPIEDYLSLYAQYVINLRQTTFETSKQFLEKQITPLRVGISILDVGRLVFVLPYHGTVIEEEKNRIAKNLSYHFERNKSIENPILPFSLNRLQSFSVDKGTVEFAIWDIDTLGLLEKEYHLTIGD